ncbi:hypothetical protein EMIHUDRAFT_222627 [Emiliania huxleyi CCMP1516]|uniref:B9 domain-containing protein 1 n=2 Tax=Emiliania huxleyi TaxID=2903 RepID=A0A0D3KXP5_EMIH1|nr:hypothetical protein EMIHUDRAFT_222627 [Emiliania huxleyi CCMP1516]EOD40530.1 hypothetical protein EMIHUDRAFT_222627 [Emiliania huxleyi CCMP1516]|eukprot:XP_005792959.1 hypothetical protein EMIHUDRAFT_222627 [Emiliania huxleyi CCMP1516]
MAAPSAGQQRYFNVMATGQIESGRFEGNSSLYCRYVFSCGEDWSVMCGVEEGITQMASSSGSTANGSVVWNFPIDATFRSTCPHGWPQLVLSVYGEDYFGRPDMILGYGAVHLPLTPGRHRVTVRTFRPLASSLLGRLQSWLNGMRPEFIESLFPAKGEGREATSPCICSPRPALFSTTGMEQLGYAVPPPRAEGVRLIDPLAATIS